MDKPAPRSLLWMFPVVLGFALVVFGIGVYLAAQPAPRYELLAAGCVCVFAVLALWCLALNQHVARQDDLSRLVQLVAPLHERLQQINSLLTLVSEQQLISERAKGIAFRDSEREALRRAIRDEIGKKDYDAALVLANDIERVFGYKQEAERFRQEVGQLRQEESRKAIAEATEAIDRFCRAEQWNQALREAEKVMAQFAGDPQAQSLPQEIENRRAAHKKQLRESWHAAVARHDVDGSVEILKQLDPYLTPAEAADMQETARRVLKDRMQLLGQQFGAAMKDHRWAEALQIGQTLMQEYPNSRMAQEVRDKIDLLRQRAGPPAVGAAV